MGFRALGFRALGLGPRVLDLGTWEHRVGMISSRIPLHFTCKDMRILQKPNSWKSNSFNPLELCIGNPSTICLYAGIQLFLKGIYYNDEATLRPLLHEQTGLGFRASPYSETPGSSWGSFLGLWIPVRCSTATLRSPFDEIDSPGRV